MLSSWLCPDSPGRHVFTWTGPSANHADRPSGYCECGAVWYDTNEKRITVNYSRLETGEIVEAERGKDNDERNYQMASV